jgi:hypothetical protein
LPYRRAQPVDLTCKPILAARVEGRSEFSCEDLARMCAVQDVRSSGAWVGSFSADAG